MGNYKFTCRFETQAILPPIKGSTFRGVFGRALKRVVCALRLQQCDDCMLREQCLYTTAFEMNTLPHPFVIEPPLTTKTDFSKGDGFDFNLLLFGPMNEKLPYFIYAFKEMGRVGIGRRVNGQRGNFALQEVKCDYGVIYDAREEKIILPNLQGTVIPKLGNFTGDKTIIKVNLITPLRLKYKNHLAPDLPFHVLIRAALRRLSSLYKAYGEGEPELDYTGLVRRAEEVNIIQNNISWFDWRRYSFRQERAMFMGGLVGSVTYEGDLAPYIPLLDLCQQVHVGKQTAFGLGKIEVETRSR